MLIGHLHVYFEGCLFKAVAHFWMELVFCFWVVGVFWYILDNSPLSNVGFANIFSHSVDSLSCGFPFEAQKFSILSSIYLLFSFVAFAFIIKLLLSPRLWKLTPMFSCQSWIILAFTFRSLVHFQLIFVCCEIDRLSSFIPLCEDIQLSWYIFLKRPFFSQWSIWHSCQKPVAHKGVGFILEFHF